MLNFNFGRSFFFNGGTCEIKFLSSRLDSQGRVFAKVTNLVTGKRTLRNSGDDSLRRFLNVSKTKRKPGVDSPGLSAILEI